MARIISVALPKGGVGKTTTAVNLAASLAVAEQRTLLIDMDTFGASGLSLGFTEGTVRSGLYEVFNFVTGIQNAIHRTELKYLDFIPANVRSMQMEERIIRRGQPRHTPQRPPCRHGAVRLRHPGLPAVPPGPLGQRAHRLRFRPHPGQERALRARCRRPPLPVYRLGEGGLAETARG